MKKPAAVVFGLLLFVGLAFWLFRRPSSSQTPLPVSTNRLTESQARAIAEKTCIKGGEALSQGSYNENSQTWWFDANLNAAKPGCSPACVVSESSKSAEINWRCTGLIPPKATTADQLKQVFAQKYPQFATTIDITISKESGNHVRGGVSMVAGEPGGIFLAAKKDAGWEIVFEGNGVIPCTLSDLGFPPEMLADCN